MREFGLIGKTLGYSFSKAFFAGKFSELHLQDCSYENFELQSIDEFPALLQSHPQLAGLNVTIPYKEEILPFLHQLTPEVSSIGACNCIRFSKGQLIAHNTDWIGFALSLQPYLKPHHKNALILGSGGASKAVQYALSQKDIQWKVVSRQGGDLHYNDLNKAVLETNLLIVNTTPLGTFPRIEEAPPIPYHLLSPQHLLYDLVYNPAETPFLKKGKAQGAIVLNGAHMLELQAEESWRIWNSG
jgi:shikimate dehydrogenase